MIVDFRKSDGQITFDFLRKHIATLQTDESRVEAKNLRLSMEYSLEMLGTKIVADWRDLAHKMVDDKYTCYFRVPASGWQHFKQDYAPKWFIQRYPVVMKSHKRTVRFTRYAVYPMANIAIPEGSRLQMMLGGERIEDRVDEL